MPPKPLDLVVYGASGFTGQLVCQYLRRAAPPGLRWGLAGRDAAKLEQVAAACDDAGGAGAAPREIVGGCDAAGAAARLPAMARVVLSTAGPFVRYSDALVGACARCLLYTSPSPRDRG